MNRPMRMGGMGGFNGQFTRIGRAIALYYAVAGVLGAILANWLHASWVGSLLLHPIGYGFAPWQLVSHMLVYYPISTLSFVLNLLMFWLFAWQVEYQVGRRFFLYLVFGVPLMAGLVGLGLGLIGLTQAPLAGFTLVINVLFVAFAMLNRNAVINFFFLFPMRASQLIWLLVGFEVLSLIFGENPYFVYQMAAIGVTWMSFRRGRLFDAELLRLRWKKRRLERKQSRFSVIHGGRDDNDDGPVYH